MFAYFPIQTCDAGLDGFWKRLSGTVQLSFSNVVRMIKRICVVEIGGSTFLDKIRRECGDLNF